jgi:hypothetical protein
MTTRTTQDSPLPKWRLTMRAAACVVLSTITLALLGHAHADMAPPPDYAAIIAAPDRTTPIARMTSGVQQ